MLPERVIGLLMVLELPDNTPKAVMLPVPLFVNVPPEMVLVVRFKFALPVSSTVPPEIVELVRLSVPDAARTMPSVLRTVEAPKLITPAVFASTRPLFVSDPF